jgi:hypothetical protein
VHQLEERHFDSIEARCKHEENKIQVSFKSVFTRIQKLLLDGVGERNKFRHEIQQAILLMVY